MDKYEELKKEILKMRDMVDEACGQDSEVDFMGNGCNAFEVAPAISHLLEVIEELDEKYEKI
jgi:hypothetical protein